MVDIVHLGVSYPARALIDPGSEASFITERLQKRLKLPTQSITVTVSGVNSSTYATSKKNCSLRIGSRFDSSLIVETCAFVLPKISGSLPSCPLSSNITSRLPNIGLADDRPFDSRPVDLLLGADLYPQILREGTQRNILGSMLAQNTIFGWILTGPMPSSSVQVFTTVLDIAEEESLSETLLRSPSDMFRERNYRATTVRDSEGRYAVTLPFNSGFPQTLQLGDSRRNGSKQFCRSKNTLLR
ncbi:uncharacterized protein [Musca autumnalis]|uniref:uncharacterized protein n=1 Tax=Musca autumnalis TaxID=221902 RepID=UPI003CE6913B